MLFHGSALYSTVAHVWNAGSGKSFPRSSDEGIEWKSLWSSLKCDGYFPQGPRRQKTQCPFNTLSLQGATRKSKLQGMFLSKSRCKIRVNVLKRGKNLNVQPHLKKNFRALIERIIKRKIQTPFTCTPLAPDPLILSEKHLCLRIHSIDTSASAS